LEVANATKAVNDLINNAALTAAQTEYDLVQAQKDLRSAQAKRNALDVPRASEDSLELAQLKYDNAQKELDRIQKEYNSSDINGRKTLIEALEVAKKARNDALSNLNYKLGKPSETDYSEADAYLHYLEQQVADLQRKLTIYQAGPDPDELGIAQARLENANNQLAAAEAALADLEIKAPFDGVVVNLTMKVGQYMSPGEVCLTLADFSKWAIKTTNLTELNVLNIHIGSPAEIRFDALPGETFTGTVTYINPLGESQQGDITYTAMISLDKTDARLRWNMTAPVVIQTK
jgi:multidrug resistance efflux pump